MPVVPILDEVIVLPLVGEIDEPRARAVLRGLLLRHSIRDPSLRLRPEFTLSAAEGLRMTHQLGAHL